MSAQEVMSDLQRAFNKSFYLHGKRRYTNRRLVGDIYDLQMCLAVAGIQSSNWESGHQIEDLADDVRDEKVKLYVYNDGRMELTYKAIICNIIDDKMKLIETSAKNIRTDKIIRRRTPLSAKVNKYENDIDCVVRAFREKLGIDIEKAKSGHLLKYIKSIPMERPQTYYPGIGGKIHVLEYRYDIPHNQKKSKYTSKEGDVLTTFTWLRR